MELKDRILEKYRIKIINGELKEGAALPTQRELAESESISKSVANSIFNTLEREGLIRSYPRKKSVVADWKNSPTCYTLQVLIDAAKKSPTDETIKTFEEFRIFNEGKCAALAAQHRTTADLEKLKEALEKIHKARDTEDFAAAHLAFHETIFSASHNFLYSAIAACFKEIFYNWGKSNYIDNLSTLNDLLEKIYGYIKKQDAVMAEAAMNIYSYESSIILKDNPYN